MNTDLLYPEIVIAGCGNPAYADDGFGPAVVEELNKLLLPDNVRVVDAGLCGPQFIFTLLDPKMTRKLIIIDSMDFGAKPGMITLLRPRDFPEGCIRDSHTGGILESLGQINPEIEVILIGCQPQVVTSTELTPGLSEEVLTSVPRAVRIVMELIHARHCTADQKAESAGPLTKSRIRSAKTSIPTEYSHTHLG